MIPRRICQPLAASALVVGILLAGLVSLAGVGCDNDENDGGMMGGNGMMGDGGMMGEHMKEAHMEQGKMPDWMMSRDRTMEGNEGMMGGGMMRDMRVIRRLLRSHEKIERTVEEIPGGVRTETTSSDTEIAEAIRTHVRQMKERMEEGRPIRRMDPVFRELFEHSAAVELEYEPIEGGVRVIETSANPQVTLLIRQHAKRAVSEFVDRGMRRAMEPTPLPDGYEDE